MSDKHKDVIYYDYMTNGGEKMEKKRGNQAMAIAALFIAVIGLSLGFAAFSTTLTIKSRC